MNGKKIYISERAPILYMISLCKRYQITLVNILFIPHNHIEYNYFIIVIRIPKYRNSSQMKPGLALICWTAMRSDLLFFLRLG